MYFSKKVSPPLLLLHKKTPSKDSTNSPNTKASNPSGLLARYILLSRVLNSQLCIRIHIMNYELLNILFSCFASLNFNEDTI